MLRLRLPGKLSSIAVLWLAVLGLGAPAAAGQPRSTPRSVAGTTPEKLPWERRYYVVKRGDTLRRIADELGVKETSLRRWNKIPANGMIVAGSRLRYAVAREASAPEAAAKPATESKPATKPKPKPKLSKYKIRRGDTLRKVAKKLGVSEKALREHNDLPDSGRIYAGRTLRYVAPAGTAAKASKRKREKTSTKPIRKLAAQPRFPATPLRRQKPRGKRFPKYDIPASRLQARSIGRPGEGRLVNPARLPKEGRGFRRMNANHSYGTDQTIALIKYGAARLAAHFRGTQPLLVGGISDVDGGKLSHHVSHQNGLDVDLAFLEKGNPKRKYYKSHVKPEEIDYRKMWFLFETWLLTGKLNYVFVDQTILPGLRARAKKVGWREKDLERLFGVDNRTGRDRIFRHEPGHKWHAHVRFTCHPADGECRHSRFR